MVPHTVIARAFNPPHAPIDRLFGQQSEVLKLNNIVEQMDLQNTSLQN